MNKLKDVFFICIDFIAKYKRYFTAGIVGIFMVFLLAFGTDDSAADLNPLTGAYQSYSEEDTDSDIVALLTTYYKAYADNDIETLTSVASPVSDREKSYIAFLADAIESYDIDQVYTKRGVDNNSYLVSAKIGIHFLTIENPAPGLDFFYVVRNADTGELKIDNTYSSFNQQNGEYEMDPTVASLIAEFEQQDDVLKLQAQIQTEYNELVASNSLFNTFSTQVLPQEIQKWASNYKAEEEAAKQAAEEEAKKQAEEEAAKAEAEAKEKEEAEAAAKAEAEKAEREANSYKVKTNAKVNVRAEASKDSEALGKADKGQELTAYGEEGDWTKLSFNGQDGYIKNEFLEKLETDAADNAAADGTEEATEETAATTNTSFAVGDKLTLTQTVNVRESMSETASKVAVAYAGESVEIVMSYQEGWTKVKYDGKTGYIKTDLLQ